MAGTAVRTPATEQPLAPRFRPGASGLDGRHAGHHLPVRPPPRSVGFSATRPSWPRDLCELLRHPEAAAGALRRAAATHKELLADWPADRMPPSPAQLYEWLGRAVGQGLAQRLGSGTRNDPYRFRLPPPPDPFGLPELPPLR